MEGEKRRILNYLCIVQVPFGGNRGDKLANMIDDQITTPNGFLSCAVEWLQVMTQVRILVLGFIHMDIKQASSAQSTHPQTATGARLERTKSQEGTRWQSISEAWASTRQTDSHMAAATSIHPLLAHVGVLWLNLCYESEFILLQLSKQFPRLLSTAAAHECAPRS